MNTVMMEITINSFTRNISTKIILERKYTWILKQASSATVFLFFLSFLKSYVNNFLLTWSNQVCIS